MARRKGRHGLKGRLLDKSIEAYILALETINRLSVKYRVEAFTYLLCNAWELLLKAKLLYDAEDERSVIYYPLKKNERPRTLSLRDCLKSVFPDERDPMRVNAEFVAELRDECVHLVIAQVPKDVMGLLQSCVLNYHACLGTWFGISLSDQVPVGMMTLVYDLNPDEFDLHRPVLRRKLGREAATYLAAFQAQIREHALQLGNPSEFQIDISYSLVLTKKPGEADITLRAGESGSPLHIVEVPKDPARTHPHRQTEIVDMLNASLGAGFRVNRFDVQCVVQVYQVRKRSEFFYQGGVRGAPAQYSDTFLTWLLNEHQNDPAFFQKARQKAKEKQPERAS